VAGYRRDRQDKEKIRQAYSLLNVMPGDSAAKIKKEYHLLVKKFHPDNFVTNLKAMENATEKTKALNAAYSLIKNAPLQKEEATSDPITIEYEPTGYSQTEYSRGQTANQYDAPYQPSSQRPKFHSFREYFNSAECSETLYYSTPRRFIFGLLFGGLSPLIILRLMDTLYRVIDDIPLFPQESITKMSPVVYTVLIGIGMFSGIYSAMNRDRFLSFWLTFAFCAASLTIPLGLLFAASIKVLTTLLKPG
jgi:hypothetical protein